jgi:hypothetical protein
MIKDVINALGSGLGLLILAVQKSPCRKLALSDDTRIRPTDLSNFKTA